jgi:UDP-N-acetylglucosamine 2-epimerase (non-hydrolysing)/GDP/UDP-N,N'-diacetylbacillosamine 2-epimerase (hydrolysing)
MRKLWEDPAIDMAVLVAGGHLLLQQGYTLDKISADGFPIDEQVDMVLAGDSSVAVAKSLGLGIIGFADALARIRPDMLVVLGDRYEALGVAVTAAMQRIVVVHLCGGEITQGSADDWVRHAITKVAHVHFTATADFRRRVIQLGEPPERVYSVGSPGLDAVRATKILDRAELGRTLGTRLESPLIAVTYHPATADPEGSRAGALGLFEALERFPQATVIVTGTNVDIGGLSIRKLIGKFAAGTSSKVVLRASLGRVAYLSLLSHADVVVGNSSSAIVEAPALRTPTVNVGSRQDGRPRANSVIDCGEGVDEIESAIKEALSPDHRRRTAASVSPYGDGYSADRIVTIIKQLDPTRLIDKQFYDVDLSAD